MRLLCLMIALAAPAASSAQPGPSAPLAEAAAAVDAQRVNLRVGCPVPLPATWNAPPWEQQAAAGRRAAFDRCLADVMLREQDRLESLARRVGALQAQDPDADWTGVEQALAAKADELETLEGKLRGKENWANAAVRILDTFTGPGAPFDTGRRTPLYRRDSSTSAPGIR